VRKREESSPDLHGKLVAAAVVSHKPVNGGLMPEEPHKSNFRRSGHFKIPARALESSKTFQARISIYETRAQEQLAKAPGVVVSCHDHHPQSLTRGKFTIGAIAALRTYASKLTRVSAIMKSLRIQSALGLLFRPCTANPIIASSLKAQTRWAHSNKSTQPPTIPATTPFVPDVETFLTLIGRDLKQHASKFPTWDALFTLTTDQLRELGLEPPRSRKYLLRWRQRFREGRFGIGGDLKYVENGAASLKVLETEKNPILTLRHVVNLPAGKRVEDLPREELARPRGFKVKGVRTIVGPYALPTEGGGATIKVTEGMWEDKRGHKVDGGERRQAEVRFKRRVAERKALREKQH